MNTKIVNGTIEILTADNEQVTIYIERGTLKMRKNGVSSNTASKSGLFDYSEEPSFLDKGAIRITDNNVIYPTVNSIVTDNGTMYVAAFGELMWDKIRWSIYLIDPDKGTVVSSTDFETVSIMGEDTNRHIARIRITPVSTNTFLITYCRNKVEFIGKVCEVRENTIYVGSEYVLATEFADSYCIMTDGVQPNRFYCLYSVYAGNSTWDVVPVIFDVEKTDIVSVLSNTTIGRRNFPFHVSCMEGQCVYRYTDDIQEGYNFNGMKLYRFNVFFTKFTSQRNTNASEYSSDISMFSFSVYHDDNTDNIRDCLITHQVLFPFKGKYSKDRLSPKNVGYLARAIFPNHNHVILVAVSDTTVRLSSYSLANTIPSLLYNHTLTVDGVLHYVYMYEVTIYLVVLKNKDLYRYRVNFDKDGTVFLEEEGMVLDMFQEASGYVTGNNETKWAYTQDNDKVVLVNVFKHRPKVFSYWVHKLDFNLE